MTRKAVLLRTLATPAGQVWLGEEADVLACDGSDVLASVEGHPMVLPLHLIAFVPSSTPKKRKRNKHKYITKTTKQ